jgi:hypothetical protein
MTDKRKEAWRLHVQAGMPVRAIAEALGVPVGTVKAWLHRDKRRGVQYATDDVGATDTDTATGATATGVEPATATATDTATGTSATDNVNATSPAIDTDDATGQVALAPPPPDVWGRPYISLIATFSRHGACPVCHKSWPTPAWNSSDSMRRLVVLDLGGDGEPRERLMLQLVCRACAESGPRGLTKFAQVVPARLAGDCFDCNRNPRDPGPSEFVRCVDNVDRCFKHAERWWQHAGQIDYSERPCAECGRTDNLFVSDDGQVRCKACRLRAWRRDREGVDAPGRGLPLGL